MNINLFSKPAIQSPAHLIVLREIGSEMSITLASFTVHDLGVLSRYQKNSPKNYFRALKSYFKLKNLIFEKRFS